MVPGQTLASWPCFQKTRVSGEPRPWKSGNGVTFWDGATCACCLSLVPTEQDVVCRYCSVPVGLEVASVSSVWLPWPGQTCPSRKTYRPWGQTGWAGKRSQDPAGSWLMGLYLFFYVVIIYNYVFCFPFLLDKNGFKSLGKFVSSPTKEKGNLQLSYSDGSDCGHKKITTNITLICKPGEPF